MSRMDTCHRQRSWSNRCDRRGIFSLPFHVPDRLSFQNATPTSMPREEALFLDAAAQIASLTWLQPASRSEKAISLGSSHIGCVRAM